MRRFLHNLQNKLHTNLTNLPYVLGSQETGDLLLPPPLSELDFERKNKISMLLTGTVLVNNLILTRTVPVNIFLLTRTVPVNNSLLTRTLISFGVVIFVTGGKQSRLRTTE